MRRTRRLWLVGATIAGAAGFAFLFWLANYVLQSPPGSPLDLTKRFYWGAEAANYSGAYQTLSPELQAEQTLETFQESVERNAALFAARRATWSVTEPDGFVAVEGTIETEDRSSALVNVWLRRSERGWRIVAYSIGDGRSVMAAGKAPAP